MIRGKLINPRVVFDGQQRHSFDNTLIISDDDAELERIEMNFPYELRDSEVEALVVEIVRARAESAQASDFDSIVQWDWMEWDQHGAS